MAAILFRPEVVNFDKYVYVESDVRKANICLGYWPSSDELGHKFRYTHVVTWWIISYMIKNNSKIKFWFEN